MSKPKPEANVLEVKKLWFKDLPPRIEGDVIAVDSYAASTNMSILLSKKPKNLFVVNELNYSEVSKCYDDYLLIGESDTLPSSEFAINNTPHQIIHADLEGKNILWMSVNGSRMFEEAVRGATGRVFAGAFNNSQAITSYVGKTSKKLTILIAGNRREEFLLEDSLCAEFLESKLLNQPIEWEEIKQKTVDFMLSFYKAPYVSDDIPFIVDEVNKYTIVPECISTNKGYLRIINATK